MQLAQATQRLLRAYPRIFFACHQRHRRDPGSETELSAHQASILDHLDERQGTGVTELAEHMGITPSTMSLHADRLETAGYLKRRRDPKDRRRVELVLTPAGGRMKQAGSVLEPEAVRALLRRLSVEERAAGVKGLELLAGAADALQSEWSRERAWARRGTTSTN